MKRGFTLIELLGVIIVLAAILAIVAPIVTDLVRDSRNKTKEASIEMYGRALRQAALTYELETKKIATSFEEIEPYLKYDGTKVECVNTYIGPGGDVRLEQCSVDGKLIDDFSYGSMTLGSRILAHAKQNNYYYTDVPDFSKVTGAGEFGLYKAEDDLGTSYYFRGDVENNYVQFANMYWRIVRINGDNTIRLIYDGVTLTNNSTAHTATVSQSYYNEIYEDHKYVGYTYEENGSQIDSTIKRAIDEWYTDNLKNDYAIYLADEIFCNDREITDEYDEYYYMAYYGAYSRLSNNVPALTCINKEDRYTVNDSIGNGLLNNPIGLLTADEAMMSGGVLSILNSNYYLYSGEAFYTISSESSGGDGGISSYVYIVTDYEITSEAYGIYGYYVDSELGVRPVINLKVDVDFTGT